MKEKIKKYLPEILSFIIPILIMLISCLISKIYPFGKESIVKYDGYYQYVGFTSYYRNVLLGKESLFYSFKGLLGYNFYATAIYYLFNPTNLLCIFSTSNTMLEYYTYIIFLRIGLSGLTMCKYLKYKFKNQSNIRYIIFSLCYALMAYNVCYYFNFMYFDTVVLFPITMIGLEKLIHERKNKLYIISLTISILSNFYIGYMVCIFSLLYFIYQMLINNNKDKKIIKDFIISSLLSGLMCMIILIPEALELLKGKALLYVDSVQTNYFKFNLNFINIFYKSFPGSMTTFDLKYGTVNIYVTLLTTVLVIKYFFNKNISKRERLITLKFVLFFLLSISFNLIDYAWHLFQRPIWYPNRYIFTFSFFLITIAMKELTNIEKEVNVKRNIFTIIIYLLLIIYPILHIKFYTQPFKIISLILSIILLIQYMFFLNNKNAKFLLIVLFFTEITFNTIMTIKEMPSMTTVDYYKLNNSVNQKAVDYIQNKEKDNNNFYRMELYSTSIYNAPSIYNYNGINHFNSVRNARVLNFLKRFNYEVRDETNAIFNNYNPYITSILGVKYLNANNDELYYENIYNENPFMYLNKDALSIGYMIYNKTYDITNDYNKNTENIVNALINSKYENEIYKVLDTPKLYKSKIIEKDNVKYIEQESDLESYSEFSGKANEDMLLIPNENINLEISYKLYINDKEIINISAKRLPIFLKKNDTYKIIMKTNANTYKYDYTKWSILYYKYYEEFINELSKNQFEVTKYDKDSYIEGKIEVNDDKNILLLTIPYDKGWNIYINDKKVDYDICMETFTCIKLDKGSYNIKLRYIPQGFIVGLIISLSSLIITVIYTKKK